MRSKRLIVFVIATFLITFPGLSSSRAQQQYIPGVTDITSMTAVSTPDSARFVLFLRKGCQDSTYFTHQVRDLVGTVMYRPDLKSYVVSYGIPNTIDSQWTGIVCNCPQIDKWLGKSIIFSGRYYQARGVMIKYGGEAILYLHVLNARLSER